MNIEFNKVTWYSKILALVLSLIIFAVAFYLGSVYSQVKSLETVASDPQPSTPAVETKKVETTKVTEPTEDAVSANDGETTNAVSPVDTSTWATYTNKSLGIEFKYPSEYEVLENIPDTVLIANRPAQLLVRIKGKETSGNTIVFHKVKSTLNKEIAKLFSWNVYSMEKVGQNGIGYVMKYFTGDAYYVADKYVFTSWRPTSPGDVGEVPMDVIVAELEGSISTIGQKSTEESIMDTFMLVN